MIALRMLPMPLTMAMRVFPMARKQDLICLKLGEKNEQRSFWRERTQEKTAPIIAVSCLLLVVGLSIYLGVVVVGGVELLGFCFLVLVGRLKVGREGRKSVLFEGHTKKKNSFGDLVLVVDDVAYPLFCATSIPILASCRCVAQTFSLAAWE
jgi:hypothetical protein